MLNVRIKENSWIAKIAALKFNNQAVAITIGRTIFLYKVPASDFVRNASWFRHELEHVRQFKKYGIVKFLCMYLIETIKKGYYQNKWEVAARAAEKDIQMNEKCSVNCKSLLNLKNDEGKKL